MNITGKKCLVLGAGGAARAIIYALIQMKAGKINILNRHYDRAFKLSNWAGKLYGNRVAAIAADDIDFTEINIIINCTPLGMWPDTEASPIDLDHIKKGVTLIDTVYNPLQTKWLQFGKEKGALTLGGLDMFIYQGAASVKIWNPGFDFEKIDLDQLKKVLIWEL